MADLLPVNFAIPGETTLINIDWTDYATRTGYKAFYCANSVSGTGGATVNFFLTENSSIRSGKTEIETSGGTDTTSSSASFDLSPFIDPLLVKGKAIITFSSYYDMTAGGDVATVTATLRKVSGVTVTDLGTMTRTSSSVSDEDATAKNRCFVFEVAETLFKKGDILRLFLEVKITNTTGSGKVCTFGADPAGRDGTRFTAANGTTTRSVLYLPLKVER